MINYSINTGIFPITFKEALIVTIHKSGLLNQLKNHRPIREFVDFIDKFDI